MCDIIIHIQIDAVIKLQINIFYAISWDNKTIVQYEIYTNTLQGNQIMVHQKIKLKNNSIKNNQLSNG